MPHKLPALLLHYQFDSVRMAAAVNKIGNAT